MRRRMFAAGADLPVVHNSRCPGHKHTKRQEIKELDAVLCRRLTRPPTQSSVYSRRDSSALPTPCRLGEMLRTAGRGSQENRLAFSTSCCTKPGQCGGPQPGLLCFLRRAEIWAHPSPGFLVARTMTIAEQDPPPAERVDAHGFQKTRRKRRWTAAASKQNTAVGRTDRRIQTCVKENSSHEMRKNEPTARASFAMFCRAVWGIPESGPVLGTFSRHRPIALVERNWSPNTERKW